jgi:hypothetical protein
MMLLLMLARRLKRVDISADSRSKLGADEV